MWRVEKVSRMQCCLQGKHVYTHWPFKCARLYPAAARELFTITSSPTKSAESAWSREIFRSIQDTDFSLSAHFHKKTKMLFADK